MSLSPASNTSKNERELSGETLRPASRIAFLSLANVVSAIAVVTLHTNGIFWTFNSDPHSYWPSANIIESVFYFAVPIFFMISGTTLLEYRDRYDTKTYFRKRITKTLIPFLFWSVIGSLCQFFVVHGVAYTGILAYFNDLINTKFIPIYWFFPLLFILYLIIPIFSAIPTEWKRKIFWYVFLVGFVCNILIPFIISVSPYQVEWHFTFPPAANYVLYALIGYLIATSNLARTQRIIAYIFGVIGLIAHIAGTYYLSMQAGEIVRTFKGYENLPCLLYSVAVFILLQQIGNHLPKKAITLVDFLTRYSFPVYLLHWFVLQIIAAQAISVDTTTLAYRLLTPLAVYALIIPVAWLVRKIPGGRYILP